DRSPPARDPGGRNTSTTAVGVRRRENWVALVRPEKTDGQPGRRMFIIPSVIYQDPLAYLLGLEGIALLDAWAGDHDRAFTEARLAEIRRLLDDEQRRDRGVLVEQVSAATVYDQISAGYDADAGGGLFATDEPLVAEYLASREPGVALDAACGT